jgi:putative oxidoreductase
MAKGGAKLIFPGLAGFYETMAPVVYALTRVTMGVIFLVHGYTKLSFGSAALIRYLKSIRSPAPELAAYCSMFIETVGGICLILGLFTRFFSAVLAIQMLVALYLVHWAAGFMITSGRYGYEYVLLLGVVLFAIAIRGGGPYSLDAKISKEL